jgi:hypothetical protein
MAVDWRSFYEALGIPAPVDTQVPALPAFGNGPQLGYAPQDSYRLLPGEPGLPALGRDTSASKAAMDAAEQPGWFSEERGQQQRAAGLVHDLEYDKDGTAWAVDPKTGQRSYLGGGPGGRQSVTAKMQPKIDLASLLMGPQLGGMVDNFKTPDLSALLSGFGGSSAHTQASPWWQSATGQGGSNDGNHSSAGSGARSLT